MSNTGWIKLHRQLRDSPYYKEPKALSVWIECLMRANHGDSKQLLKRQMISLKAGQFVMGGKEFGESVGVAKSTVWYWLGIFEADGMLDTKKTTKGTIVSIKNWDRYQSTDALLETNGTQMGRKWDYQKNDKNDKNDKKKERGRFTPPSLEDLSEYINSNNYEVNPQRFIDFYSSKGWMVGRNKMKDWKAAVRTWERRSRDEKKGKSIEELTISAKEL